MWNNENALQVHALNGPGVSRLWIDKTATKIIKQMCEDRSVAVLSIHIHHQNEAT
jgi:hypothetical protein